MPSWKSSQLQNNIPDLHKNQSSVEVPPRLNKNHMKYIYKFFLVILTHIYRLFILLTLWLWVLLEFRLWVLLEFQLWHRVLQEKCFSIRPSRYRTSHTNIINGKESKQDSYTIGFLQITFAFGYNFSNSLYPLYPAPGVNWSWSFSLQGRSRKLCAICFASLMSVSGVPWPFCTIIITSSFAFAFRSNCNFFFLNHIGLTENRSKGLRG